MARRPLPEDFREFVDSLNANEVKYLLVGGWAVGLYGNPRATKDIDFLIAVDDANLRKLRKALYEFGAPTIDMGHFKKPGNFFSMGSSPVRIDIITAASGIAIEDCYKRRRTVDVDGTRVAVISRQDLVRNKKASGRHQDLADAEVLEGKQGKGRKRKQRPGRSRTRPRTARNRPSLAR
jgi:predicted nucleotidyltransferase